ncbi:MAG: hypothetical protein ACFFAO_21270, partial [Candidatus Hermodarchaeota archaeon]
VIGYNRESYKICGGRVNILFNIKLYSCQNNKKILIKSLMGDKILEIDSPNTKIERLLKKGVKQILSLDAIAFNEYMLFITKRIIKKNSNFVNEFPGEEIELKFENIDELMPKRLYYLFQNKVNNFQIEKNFPFFCTEI